MGSSCWDPLWKECEIQVVLVVHDRVPVVVAAAVVAFDALPAAVSLVSLVVVVFPVARVRAAAAYVCGRRKASLGGGRRRSWWVAKKGPGCQKGRMMRK